MRDHRLRNSTPLPLMSDTDDLSEILSHNAVHLCVDMQNMFARDTEWHTPWLERVLPRVVRLVEAAPAQTIFTRFIPARNAEERQGTWRNYYRRWESLTLDRLAPEMVELVPDLARFVPPGRVVDKRVYSPWFQPELAEGLRAREVGTLVVSGGETDVCVLATVLGAVDRGYRIVVARDALCSSSDTTHDAMMALYSQRYGHQVDLRDTAEIVEAWPRRS